MDKINFKGSVMLNPTPVVLVTTKNNEGKINVFTIGWVSTVCTKPPVLAVGIRPERLSYDYIKESMECVINLTTRDMVKIVDYCGVRTGKKEDKIKHLDLNLDPGVSISTPSLSISPVALECKVKSITPLGTHDMFLLDITNVKVDEELIDENGKICFNKADLICYNHGEYFGLNPKPLGYFGYSIKKKRKNKPNKKSQKK
jgi:flavin reductase (DIM6/NTAB) family NADH-FMN oxidoreductase RutF